MKKTSCQLGARTLILLFIEFSTHVLAIVILSVCHTGNPRLNGLRYRICCAPHNRVICLLGGQIL